MLLSTMVLMMVLPLDNNGIVSNVKFTMDEETCTLSKKFENESNSSN